MNLVGHPWALDFAAVTAGYGASVVLREVDLAIGRGQVVALLGPNGAGKTTLIRTASGEIRPTGGQVSVNGRNITTLRTEQRARAGLCVVPEGRGVFPSLTVKENLRLQTSVARDAPGIEAAVDAFPDLKDRMSHRAGSLSGGQQQMLALARCFSTSPSVIMLDEVSMGLAPRVIDVIFEAILSLASSGVSILLVEQYISRALEMADHVYVLDRGRITYSGSPSNIDEQELTEHYLSGRSG